MDGMKIKALLYIISCSVLNGKHVLDILNVLDMMIDVLRQRIRKILIVYLVELKTIYSITKHL